MELMLCRRRFPIFARWRARPFPGRPIAASAIVLSKTRTGWKPLDSFRHFPSIGSLSSPVMPTAAASSSPAFHAPRPLLSLGRPAPPPPRASFPSPVPSTPTPSPPLRPAHLHLHCHFSPGPNQSSLLSARTLLSFGRAAPAARAAPSPVLSFHSPGSLAPPPPFQPEPKTDHDSLPPSASRRVLSPLCN